MSSPATPTASNGHSGFTSKETRILGGIASLILLRMLGFNLVIPVLSPYVQELARSTPLLVGLSFSMYALPQGLLQVPFGWLSDRWGRKPVLTIGLALLAIGSAICAVATDAWILVLGRFVQGMGAVTSVLVAMIADLTRDQVRTRAMTMVGMAIGGSFAVGLLVGPPAAQAYGVPTLFWLTAGMATVGIGYLWWKIPTPPKLSHHEDVEFSFDHFYEVIRNRELIRLDLAVFNLHLTLNTVFLMIPVFLSKLLPQNDWPKLFAPMIVIGLLVLLAGGKLGERSGLTKRVALFGQAMLITATLIFAFNVPATTSMTPASKWPIFAGLYLFVAAFALLEPLFPSLLTRICSQTNRGTAAGVYNMSQFSGAFVAGIVFGLLADKNLPVILGAISITGTLWLISALRLQDPEHMTTMEFPIDGADDDLRHALVRRLLSIQGVEDVAWNRDRARLMIRYAAERVDADLLAEQCRIPATAPR